MKPTIYIKESVKTTRKRNRTIARKLDKIHKINYLIPKHCDQEMQSHRAAHNNYLIINNTCGCCGAYEQENYKVTTGKLKLYRWINWSAKILDENHSQ